MPEFTTEQGVVIHYEDDFHGKPWSRDEAEIVVLVHGVAESSRVWYAWIPQLTAQYRVIRPDLPGFGQSSVPDDLPYEWDPFTLARDLHALMTHLGVTRFHLVGEKYGGSVVIAYAALHPEDIATLSVIGGPVQVVDQKNEVDVAGFSGQIARGGMRGWAEASMDKRLGTAVSPAQRKWWVEMMAASNARAAAASADAVAKLDMLEAFKGIGAPMLYISTQGSRLLPIRNVERWVVAARNARLVALEGDAYHPGATQPEACIRAVKEHLSAHPVGKR